MRLMTAAFLAVLSLPAQAQDGEIITKQYDDGSVYEGTFLNGRQHGTGTYKLPSGFEYSGDWVEGEITGRGTAGYPNGVWPSWGRGGVCRTPGVVGPNVPAATSEPPPPRAGSTSPTWTSQ